MTPASKQPVGFNCPILERTADGVPVGRCWFWSPDGICPRHGDAKAAIEKYKQTSKLTDERELVR